MKRQMSSILPRHQGAEVLDEICTVPVANTCFFFHQRIRQRLIGICQNLEGCFAFPTQIPLRIFTQFVGKVLCACL